MPILKAAVDVCTELNRARDFDDLNKLLGHAANVIDASGLIVWVGSAAGASLRPVLAHGYSAQALARMPLGRTRQTTTPPRRPFRTGELQIVVQAAGRVERRVGRADAVARRLHWRADRGNQERRRNVSTACRRLPQSSRRSWPASSLIQCQSTASKSRRIASASSSLGPTSAVRRSVGISDLSYLLIAKSTVARDPRSDASR